MTTPLPTSRLSTTEQLRPVTRLYLNMIIENLTHPPAATPRLALRLRLLWQRLFPGKVARLCRQAVNELRTRLSRRV